ncbi:hypothetical protein VTK73DRAFT_7679 [Phialemonium thermophilum]|uniref:Methyltransferase type 11 domain-containing protein n=1 Tax=Phialemonium thermophilum TaxID=223376 RepID=A0ABR3Y6H0_9PEZI
MMAPRPFHLPKVAAEGFKDASAYDAHRPSYPTKAVDDLLGRLRIQDLPHARVVEIGAGTGKFTEILARRPEGYDIIAVEPHEDMRSQLISKVRSWENTPGKVTVVDGHAAELPVVKESADACIAAQAFHWFANQEVLNEIHRVLKPGACLGMIWNVEDYNKPKSWKATTRWGQKLNDWVLSIPSDGTPRFRDLAWQAVFSGQLTRNLFQIVRNSLMDGHAKFSLPLGEAKVSWREWLSEEALWARVNTLSQVALLEGPARQAGLCAFREALQDNDVERNDKGEIAVHGVTYFAWTDKIYG